MFSRLVQPTSSSFLLVQQSTRGFTNISTATAQSLPYTRSTSNSINNTLARRFYTLPPPPPLARSTGSSSPSSIHAFSIQKQQQPPSSSSSLSSRIILSKNYTSSSSPSSSSSSSSTTTAARLLMEESSSSQATVVAASTRMSKTKNIPLTFHEEMTKTRFSYDWWKEWTIIMGVFAVTGSSTVMVVRPLLKDVFKMDGTMKDGPWSFRFVYLTTTLPLYSCILLTVATVAGRRPYFKMVVLRMWGRFLPKNVIQRFQ